jgi:hypothetical protein
LSFFSLQSFCSFQLHPWLAIGYRFNQPFPKLLCRLESFVDQSPAKSHRAGTDFSLSARVTFFRFVPMLKE